MNIGIESRLMRYLANWSDGELLEVLGKVDPRLHEVEVAVLKAEVTRRHLLH